MKEEICIEAFKKEDENEVLRLLSDAKLPTQDLTPDKLSHFLVARREDGFVVGTIGIEPYDEVGLLRSLVVHPSYRGSGLGRRLTDELESLAHSHGINTLYLLTMTAADYFPKLGYQPIERTNVPESISKTEEFKNVCPVSAACLFKHLNPK